MGLKASEMLEAGGGQLQTSLTIAVYPSVILQSAYFLGATEVVQWINHCSENPTTEV